MCDTKEDTRYWMQFVRVRGRARVGHRGAMIAILDER